MKKTLSMLLVLCMALTTLPVTAAAKNTLEVGGGSYALTETGLIAAINAANDGDTIKFIEGGTITLTTNIIINKSITLDLNSKTINFPNDFKGVAISGGASVTIQGPGAITTNYLLYVHSGSTLMVQGGAVIEGTGVWQVLINWGTVSMTGGALRQTNGGHVLQNSGAATFNNVTIEANTGDKEPIWAGGTTLNLNNCTLTNSFSGNGTWPKASILSANGNVVVNINGGTVTGPSGSTAPAVYVSSGATFTNNGATITNGYVKKLGDLAVSVSSGTDKVTLESQIPETGITYYYKTTTADDTANKPASYESANFDSAGWTAFSSDTDITTVGAPTVYVQVVKVGNHEQKIYGWGQGSATPTYTLAGLATISNTSPRIGDVLNASLVGGNNTGTLAYVWKVAGTQVSTDSSYTVDFADLGKMITLEISSSVEIGTITSAETTPVAKKSGPSAPSAPTLASKTLDSITLTANAAYEFSKDGSTWQTSNVFSSLFANTAYTFYQRVAENSDTESSEASAGLIVMTNSNGTDGGIGSGGSSSDDSSTVIITPPAPDKPNSPTQAEIKVPGSVDSNGNVTVSITDKTVTDAFNKAFAEAKKNGNEQNGITVLIRVDTGRLNAFNVTVNLPKTVQDTIIAKQIINTIVVVDNPDIKIDIDLATVQEINKQAKSDVNITATRKDSGKLTMEAKKAIGGRPVFDFKVNSGSGKQVQSFGTGSVSVTIPYTLGENEKAENVQAVYVDSNGKVHWIENSVYDSVKKVLRFSTSHFSTYGIGYKQQDTAFADIANHWAKEDIEFVVDLGLFDGSSPTTFSPNIAMTRGMFVTVLGRLANADIGGYTKSIFTDVKSDAYYMGYIEWARKNSIVNGVSNNQFAPDQPITREQMAVIMSNYAKTISYTLPKLHVDNTFADSVKISAYAKDAVKQMQMAGVISGKNGNLLDPQGSATRAEVSAVLRRFVDLTTVGR